MTDGVLAYALIPAVALLLDTLLGDPRSGMHPVVLIGRLISFLESLLYPAEHRTPGSLLFRGGLVVVLVVSITGGVAWGLLTAAALGGPLCSALMGAVILYFTITPRALARDGLEIYHLLRKKNIVLARKRLSWIVGRDTDRLNEPDIARGAVETIAENTTDGVLSPLFFFLLFGPVGAACYRAANTMDSMLGYKNDRYIRFGRIPAKMDDAFNYIPARVTALLMTAAAFLTGLDGKNAWKIWRRDRRKHASPNAAQTESVCAGALGVQLAGDAVYFGKVYKKEFIGDARRGIEPEDILRTGRLMYATELLTFLLCGGIRLALALVLA